MSNNYVVCHSRRTAYQKNNYYPDLLSKHKPTDDSTKYSGAKELQQVIQYN